jgi:hypothetical protein
MANEIYIPFLCPIRFYEVDAEQQGQYLTKHFDNDWTSEQLKSFETPVFYKQKWQTNDSTFLQFESKFRFNKCEGNRLRTKHYHRSERHASEGQ